MQATQISPLRQASRSACSKNFLSIDDSHVLIFVERYIESGCHTQDALLFGERKDALQFSAMEGCARTISTLARRRVVGARGPGVARRRSFSKWSRGPVVLNRPNRRRNQAKLAGRRLFGTNRPMPLKAADFEYLRDLSTERIRCPFS
jgi:hypothetical protein